jgi:outer membrane scaffolding protein for murein synthesis (MipA/OmpV family)
MPPYIRRATGKVLFLGIVATSTLSLSTAVRSADYTNGADLAPTTREPDPARFGPIRQTLHDWHVVVGAGAMYKPKYEGSDEYEISPVPFISAELFDRLTIDPSGLSVKAYQQGPFRFDVNVGYDGGRDEDDEDTLRGLGDIDWGVTVGGKATVTWGPADFFVSVDQIIGGSDGLLAKVGVAIEQPVSEQVILGASAAAVFANDNYMESYFGVDAGQSARSGYVQYKAGAGIKSVDLSVSATWLINENWVLRAEQEVDFLVGDAADSPIVKDDIQLQSMLMLGYRF